MTFIQSFDLSIVQAAGRLREAAGGFFTPLFKAITLSGTVGAVFIAAAIVFIIFRKTRKCGITASIALLFGLLFTNILMKNIIARPRPYSDVSSEFYVLWVKAGSLKESGFSFPSGHATAAFTVATFTDQWFRTAYPNSPYKGIMRASAYSLATLESVLRIAAGKHYFTDVLVGALVGTGVSFGILEMHKNRDEKYSFWVGPNVAGITLRF